MPLLDYQYSFRGLTFGSKTEIIVEKVEGLLGMNASANDIAAGEADHGAYAGSVLMPTRVVTFTMHYVGSRGTDIETKLATLASTFQVPRRRLARTTFDQLVFKRPGQPEKFLNARCTKRGIVSEYDTAAGLPEVIVELQAPDPLIYGTSYDGASMNVIAGSTTNNMNVSNVGDFSDGASPLITIFGPCTNPVIQNTTDDARQIKLNVVMASGDALVIDVKKRTVTLNGVPRYDLVRTDSQWWALLPGVNTIVYSRAAGNTALLSNFNIQWRGTWQ